MNVWRARFSTALAIILALSSMPADAIAEEADLDVSEPTLEETVTLDEEANADDEETLEDEQPVETEELNPDEVFHWMTIVARAPKSHSKRTSSTQLKSLPRKPIPSTPPRPPLKPRTCFIACIARLMVGRRIGSGTAPVPAPPARARG